MLWQVGGGTSGLTSSSDDDEEFRSISFPPDDAIQKVYRCVLSFPCIYLLLISVAMATKFETKMGYNSACTQISEIFA